MRSYLTGRQAAHLKFIRREARRDSESGKPLPGPEVSVVSWEIREEICEPYCIKAVISAPLAIPRKDVLGQFARFSIDPEDSRAHREFHGFVAKFDSVSESRDGHTYRVVIRQHLAVLDGPSNCATYQGLASWQIVKEVLDRHNLRPWMGVEFRLRREHPKHAFRFQYNMGDWPYIRLEMEQAGLYCYTTTGAHGEVLVIADDIDGYTRPPIPVLDRPSADLSTFEESIYSLEAHTRTVPKSYVVADYNPESAWDRIRDESGVVTDDDTMLGTPYVWGTHHQDEAGAKREAQLRHEAARARQVRYKVESTVLAVRPGCIVKSDNAHEDAIAGMLVTRVVHRGSRAESYMNTFRAMPANRPYRMMIDESRWPRIHGTLGATISSPGQYKFAYLTEKGEYIARFHCDFGSWPKGAESVPLRLAKPFAGKNHTGLHMPALDGDEALIGFREGNPNKPIIVGFLHNSERPDLINSSRRRMSRNEIRTQSGNKLWMDDWDDQQGIELGTEHSGRSQLNLGYLADGELKSRGAGAELRTSGHAVTRGGAGVMLSAYDRPGGSGKQLSMAETVAQLKQMLALAESLARSAEASKASPADIEAQKAISADLDELKKPGAVIAAPGPVGVLSGDGVQFAADGSIIATAKKGVHFSTLKRFTVAARDVISLFAQKGMSLISAAGNVVVQAQRGAMQLASQQDMTVETVDGVLHVKSSKEIVLNVGGSYLRMTPGGIEMGTRGGVLFKTSSLKKTGPAQMDLGGVAFAPKFVPYTTQCEVWRTNPAFVPPPEPAPLMAPARNAGAVAPSPFGDFFSRRSSEGVPPGASAFSPFDGKPSNVDSGVAGAKVTLNSPGDQQQAYVAPDPIRLVNAVPCDWKISDLKADVRERIEARSYWGVLNDRTPWKSKDGTTRYRGGGSRDSIFEFAYSEQDKAIVCTVRVMLIPMDLFPVDAEGNRDPSIRPQTIPYNYLEHWRLTPGSTEKGVKKDYRDALGDKYDVSAVRSRIEAVLNQGSYKLILDGCAKGAACGCRVKVSFKVDLRVSVKGVPLKGFSEHVSLHLYPSVLRADTSSWGEQHKWKDNQNVIHDYPIANVEAHECGHYFNFPDEYFGQGGWLHEAYIKDEQIDFSLVDANAGAMVWQGYSDQNLMGGGANAPQRDGRPSAIIRPYYLEYVRRQFSLATNKLWRVGYEA
ncbi:type VI secretion system tip protein VgrG [Paraburkholderia sp. UYCP14C]|uniref:type VI secretion system Vgr family protein n=1 Tax=Paraburkholderia sp. UYCP14C TaxID=2511130 RepID=UPI00101F2CE7|nr:type VI secretion system Vgr family protein [Paraburkholderia sp. UYCP14C]RZF29038.1 type VI secretion system tip protein VgrG [Paraburkholderia sp. UYCP14C]